METKEPNAPMTTEEMVILARKQAEASIIARAWQDGAFRTQLLEDPKAALAGIGIQLSDDVQISVREEAVDTWELVLPAKPTLPAELSDADLHHIAAAGWIENGNCKYLEELGKKVQNISDVDDVKNWVSAALGFIITVPTGNSWGWG